MLTASAIDCETHLIFPERLIAVLQDLRGEAWQALVQRTLTYPDSAIEQAAFVLLIARLAGCSTCHADTLRALRGCAKCARQTVARYRGNDEELLEIYWQGYAEIQNYLISRE